MERCSTDGMGLCNAFSTKEPKILFPDGTFIPNFNILQSDHANWAVNDADLEAKKTENLNRSVQRQLRVSAILKTLKPKLSDESIFYFTQYDGELRSIFEGKRFSYYLPWPVDSDGPIQFVPSDAVAEKFKSIFSDEQKKQLIAISDEYEKQSKDGRYKSPEYSPEARQLLIDNETYTPARKERVKALFRFVKSALIETIKAGKADAQLSEPEKAAVAKVASIDWSDESGTECDGYIPNAFYLPPKHTFHLCDTEMNVPDASLVEVIGHEIGHSIDPCGGQNGVYAIDQPALRRLSEMDSTKSNNDHYLAARRLLAQTDGLSKPGYKITGLAMHLEFSDEQLEFLKGAGAVKELSPQIPFDKYVFQDVYRCLISPAGGHFRSQTAEDREDIIKEAIAKRRVEQGSHYNASADEKVLRAALSKTAECSDMGAFTQMGETMADWFGVTAEAKFLEAEGAKQKPATTLNERMKLIGDATLSVCYDRSPPRDLKDPSAGATIKQALADKERTDDEHPLSIKRLDMMLRNQVLRERLSCEAQPKPMRECTHASVGIGDPQAIKPGSRSKRRSAK